MNTAMSESVIDMTVKPISPDTLHGRLVGREALLHMPHDVLDVDDGVVDHKADRDRKCHQ